MSVTDKYSIQFYQNVLSYLNVEDDECMYFLAGWPDGPDDRQWYQNALDALSRLGLSGLVECGKDIHTSLTDLSLAQGDNLKDTWFHYYFDITPKAKKLLSFWTLPNESDAGDTSAPGFRGALSRIFDEYGFGPRIVDLQTGMYASCSGLFRCLSGSLTLHGGLPDLLLSAEKVLEV